MKFTSNLKNFLFWQPKKDLYKKIYQSKYGKKFLIVVNYIIWVFLFFVSYLLIKEDTNIFWQLFFASIIGEFVEKFLKMKSFWKRPLHLNHNILPNGLLKSWYLKGSFPSGHTIKAVYFYIFLLQVSVMVSPLLFLLIVIPLLLIRVFLGLHYPVDVVGGVFIGFIIGILFRQIQFPQLLINLIEPIFNFIFFIK